MIIEMLSVVVAAFVTAQAEEPYAWPLDQPRALTSSFGEYRSDRFHMGIDLRTGPVGKKVYSAGDGYVSRIRCSPYGYGKAVYVQLDDGFTAIYAHLDDFIPELRDYVRRAQHDRKNYTVDLYPDPGTFRVERGQLIAYSGQTGIGVPHLHWEMRDRAGAPVSQRDLGLSWPDETAPRFRKVIVVPADAESKINGDLLPVIVNARRTDAGDYTTDRVTVSGSAVFGVDVYDPANGGASKLGVFSVETAYQGETVFRMEHDRISYDEAADGIVTYHPFYRSEGRFLMQMRWPGYEDGVLSSGAGDGRIAVSEGDGEVVIDATDFYEHSARLTVPVRSAGTLEPDYESYADTGTGRVLYNPVGDWLLITVQFDASESVRPVLLNRGKPIVGVEFHRVNDRTFRVPFALDDERLFLSVEHPRAGSDASTGALIEHEFWRVNGASRETTLGGVKLDAREADPFSRIHVTVGAAEAKSSRELEPMGPRYQLWHDRAPLKGEMKITLPWPGGTKPEGDGYAVYRRSGEDWSWMESKAGWDGITVSSRRLGDFQIMRDSTAPTLAFKRPDSGAGIANTERIELTLIDYGSSVDRWTADFNGEWLLMGYDPETNTLFWERDEPLPSGPGEITVTAWDEAGNRKTVTRSVTVR